MDIISSNNLLLVIYLLLCCICLIGILIILFFVYLLSSAKVKTALITLGLVKTVIDLIKDIYSIFIKVKKTKKSNPKKYKPTTNVSKNYIDAEFRERK